MAQEIEEDAEDPTNKDYKSRDKLAFWNGHTDSVINTRVIPKT